MKSQKKTKTKKHGLRKKESRKQAIQRANYFQEQAQTTARLLTTLVMMTEEKQIRMPRAALGQVLPPLQVVADDTHLTLKPAIAPPAAHESPPAAEDAPADAEEE